MRTLSICMIVKNEEKYLEGCLSSIKTLADEIIIVDTGSTDKTQEIAKKFTEKIFEFTWCDDFSAARNFSLQQATKDWILVLDADETIAEDDFPAIKKLLETEIIAYFFDQRNYTNNPSLTGFQHISTTNRYTKNFCGSVTISHAIRLFQNKPWIRFDWRIHESIASSLEQQQIQAVDSGIIIHHYKDEKGEDSQQQKTPMYLKIIEEQIKFTPNNPKPYYEAGVIYFSLKKFKQACTAFQKVIAIAPQEYRAYFKLARCYTQLKEYAHAIEMYKQYLTLKGDDSDAYAELGLLTRNNFAAAESYFLSALQANPANILARHNLSLLYLHHAKKKEALELLHESEKYPNPFTYNTLGILLLNENTLKAIDYFQKGIALQSPHPITIELYKNIIQAFISINNTQHAEEYSIQLKKILENFKEK